MKHFCGTSGIFIYLPGYRLTYEIFAAYRFDDTHLLGAFDFSKKKGRRAYIREVFAGISMGQNTREDVKVTAKDKLVTLSTCTSDQADGRYLVQAVLRKRKPGSKKRKKVWEYADGKRAGRVMRNVAAVLVIILAIVALFQGFLHEGERGTVSQCGGGNGKSAGRKAKRRRQGKDRMRTGKGGHISGREVCVQRRSGVDPFLGVDKEAFEEGGTVGDGKAGQADALFLLVLDTKTGKSRLIAISRDTMTDVNVYSDLGNFIGTEKLQLCLAYTYGDGKEKSCENTVRAVSRLFYGMPVAAYAALDLDAIAVLTDAVGGVEVTVTKDLTIQDPSLKEGERKVLTGEQAQWYVRSRLVEEKEATADANSDRIERQKQYLAAFGGKAAEQFRKNPLFC